MSDSLPPSFGPAPYVEASYEEAPYEEWDLDALLSGELSYVPDALRPVAAALAALRADPLRGELAGEATARAEFRTLLAWQSGPAWPAGVAGVAGPARPAGVAGWVGGTGTAAAHTLVLPARTADDRPRPVVRHHRHRRRRAVVRRGPWQAMAVLGTAVAAAVVVGVAALAGTFSGAAGHQEPSGRDTSAAHATAESSGIGPGSQAVEGGANKEPTPHPTPKASATGQPATGSGAQPRSGPASTPTALCQQYLAFFAHPEPPASWQAESPDLQQLTKLAGSPQNILGYCYQLGHQLPAVPAAPAAHPGGPGFPGSSDPQGRSGPGGYGGGFGAGQHRGGDPGRGSKGHGSPFGGRR